MIKDVIIEEKKLKAHFHQSYSFADSALNSPIMNKITFWLIRSFYWISIDSLRVNFSNAMLWSSLVAWIVGWMKESAIKGKQNSNINKLIYIINYIEKQIHTFPLYHTCIKITIHIHDFGRQTLWWTSSRLAY